MHFVEYQPDVLPGFVCIWLNYHPLNLPLYTLHTFEFFSLKIIIAAINIPALRLTASNSDR
jgi:hypothetical protein